MLRGFCRVGCAGWSLPRDVQHEFPIAGSHLERYATRLPACEINSSFYRPHSPTVWQRWADSVSEGFEFSVKLPRTITHDQRLVDCTSLLDGFLAQVKLLGPRLGCLLVQLPPSLAFEARVATQFLAALRERWTGPACAEPRHESWFSGDADALMSRYRIARVLADPIRHAQGAAPGGWNGLVYLRLHGSPRIYYSSYDAAIIAALALRIDLELKQGRDVWCIFDNTAGGAATHNALALNTSLESNPA